MRARGRRRRAQATGIDAPTGGHNVGAMPGRLHAAFDPRPRRGRLGPLFLLLMVLPGQAEWTRFRGPNGSGVAEDSNPPLEFHSTLAWEAPVPPGLSSPVIEGGMIFLTGVEGGRLLTRAIDAESGRTLWEREAPVPAAEAVHEANSQATPTPCADGDRVHVYFGSYGLLCYDREGAELWRRPLPTPQSLYGTAASPIVHGGAVIQVLDDDASLPESGLSRSRLLAVSRDDGSTVWETPRPLMRSGWSTPMIWRHAGGADLVVLGSGRLYGYDPEGGAERWYVGGFSRETISVPVAGGDHVFASASMLGGVGDAQPDPAPFWTAMLHFDRDGSGTIERSEIDENFTFPLRPELPPGHPGFGLPLPGEPEARQRRQLAVFEWSDKDRDGSWTREEFLASLDFRRGKPLLVAVRPGGAGDVTESHVEWELNRGIPEIPSPIHHRGRLYLVRNGGLLACVNAADGEVIYTERLDAPGEYSASPVIAGDHLFLLSARGRLTVVRCGDEFQVVAAHDLGEGAAVTPALDADTLYVRTEGRLLAFRRR